MLNQEILNSFMEYHNSKDQSLPIESLTKIVVAHENAKFYQGQSDANFMSQVTPYREKYGYIRAMDSRNAEEFFGEDTDNLYNDLKEKYSVDMLK